jgi:NADPH:quinone reductase-like Zn-dependent oxidoreductase
MKAFVVDRYGKGSGRLGEMPDPELREDDVLVRVHAAGVNPWTRRSETASSSFFYLIDCPSSWATKPPAWCFESGCSASSRAMRSTYAQTLRKSLNALKPGGKLISISGPPDPEFAREMGMNWGVRQVMRLMSYRIRETAKRRRVSYSFLFMKASGDQLREIGCLIDEEEIRPVVDRVYPFDSIAEALAHIETGRAKGKVVVKLR